jgi:hypothetical protein
MKKIAFTALVISAVLGSNDIVSARHAHQRAEHVDDSNGCAKKHWYYYLGRWELICL